MDNNIFASEIQIRDVGNNQIILLLICPSKKVALYIADILGNNKYKINCYTTDNNNISLGLLLEMPKSIIELRIATSKNRTNYLPMDWLFANKVNFIATGWLNATRDLFYTSQMPLCDVSFPPIDNQ